MKRYGEDGDWSVFPNAPVVLASEADTALSTLQAELERVKAELERKRIALTGLQIQHMWDYVDGDKETELTIALYPEGKDEETGETMPAGLYCWFTEYPDEGRLYLPETAEDSAISAATLGEK